jgi:hypothetical protein
VPRIKHILRVKGQILERIKHARFVLKLPLTNRELHRPVSGINRLPNEWKFCAFGLLLNFERIENSFRVCGSLIVE